MTSPSCASHSSLSSARASARHVLGERRLRPGAVGRDLGAREALEALDFLQALLQAPRAWRATGWRVAGMTSALTISSGTSRR